MIDQSRIEKGLYWQRAWKLVDGCAKVSPGCDNCWSEAETRMRSAHPNSKISTRAADVQDYEGRFTGHVVPRFDNLDLPLRTKKPTVWAVWNDLWHENVDLLFVCDVFEVMERARKLGHKFLILTKRAERMGTFLSEVDMESTDHIWWGVTVENQQAADERIPHLLRVPGKRFLSVEPMLGPICMWWYGWKVSAWHRFGLEIQRDENPIHAVILGGESGRNARPMHPDWVRSVRDQCAAAGVPFFFKQDSGSRPNKLPFLDGRQHADLPWMNGGGS